MIAETFLNGRVALHAGDCLDVLATMEPDSVDAAVCDPPYHLTSIVKRFGAEGAAPAKHGTDGAFARAGRGFMGKQWDGGDIAFRPETWASVLRVLKPGAYILAFSSSRTFGRMSVAMEEAGFITHPLVGELFRLDRDASSFARSLSPAQLDAFIRLLDRADPVAGMLGWIFGSGFPKATRIKAEGYDGFRYGAQALKPALEPIYMGQKPFSEETGTANILRHGTGAVNIDGCRVEAAAGDGPVRWQSQRGGIWKTDADATAELVVSGKGRWPANLIHDESDAVVSAFPDAPGQQRALHGGEASRAEIYGKFGPKLAHEPRGDSGSAARFFYSAKADADDRVGSKHPTVKPIDLMRYLVRLVTPPGGTVLDPFAGTGTTGEAAFREGMRAVLIEREAEYRADIGRRMALVMAGPDERKRAITAAKGAPVNLSGTLFDHLQAAE